MKEFNMSSFNEFPVMGIMRGFTLEETLPLMDVLISENWPCLEVTMNTENVALQIKELSRRYGDSINIGAGTVTSVQELEEALMAGANFIVTPILNLEVIRRCVNESIPVFPGAFSPTEIFTAWQEGASMVKVFPANQLGPSYIKNVKAPLSKIKLLATGGISCDNAEQYLNAGAAGFGIGSAVLKKDKILDQDWVWIREQIQKLRSLFPQNKQA